MSNPADTARNQLAAAGREKDLLRRLTTSLIVGALVLLVLVLVALLDYWLMLPVALRWGGLLALAGLMAAGAWKLIRLWRQPTALKEAALDVETARPALGCEVSTAAEYLSGERKPVHDYEPELVAALQERAATAIGQNRVPYSKRLWKPALVAGCGALAALAFVVVVPGAGTALKRTIVPWSRASFSHVEVQPGSLEMPVGQDLTLTNTFTGRPVTQAELHWLEEGRADWQKTALTAGEKGVFLHVLKDVRTSFKYRVTGGDAESDEFTVTAYIPPSVARLQLGLTPPAYTKLPPSEQAIPNLSVVRGTDARIRLTPNVPLRKARVVFTNDVVVELSSAADGTWEGGFRISRDTDYSLELFDAKGRRGVSPKHHLTAIPDNPPKLDITEPGQDIRAAANDRIPLKIEGSDDFGIGKVKLVYHRLGGPEQEVEVAFNSTTNHEFEAVSALPLEGLKLRDYEVVAYHAEALDNNTLDGPGVGKSPVYFIEITDIEGQQGSKSKPKPGEKVNLLTIQKQIIAETSALAGQAPKDRFEELSKRQQDAVEFGKLYQDALLEDGAPIPAQAEMNQAVKSMQEAVAALNKPDRATALPPEETALASLYKVLQLMPQLGNLPTQPKVAKKEEKPPPPAVQVVLKAIEKKKPQDPNQPELEEMLEAMRQLQQQQAQLSSQCQNPGSAASPNAVAGSPGQPPKPGEAKDGKDSKHGKDGDNKKPELTQDKPGEEQKPGDQAGKGHGKGRGKPPSDAKPLAKGKGQGQGQQQADAQGQGLGEKQNEKPGLAGKGGKPGEPKDGEKKPDEPKAEKPEAFEPTPPENPQLAQLAPKQAELSKEAKEMAERLERLAGKGARVGHGTSRQMSQAAQQLDRAAHAMRQGNAQAAIGAGDQGSAAMNSAIAVLERALAGKPDLSDVASEEAPRQYEGAISDYFKRLSRAE